MTAARPKHFEDPKAAAEAGKKGAAEYWRRRRAAKGAAGPYPGTILDMMDAAGLTGASWDPWRTFWRAVFGLPMSEEQRAVYRRHTGREEAPVAPVHEAWQIIGRRGGKSRMAALGGLYQGVRCNYRELLAPGERALVPILAPDKFQARSTLSYLKGFCALPHFTHYVGRILRDHVELLTGAEIRVTTCSFRTVRGYTLAGVVAEEVAFWLSDETGSNPDSEILAALRPGMATVPGALLLGLSSPYAAKGELYKAYQRFHGTDDLAGLAWNADTASMNPRVDASIIARAFEDDPVAAASEYGRDGAVCFRRDVESFLDAETLRAVMVPGRRELAPLPGVRYVGFVDPSGGSQDAMTLAIAHADDGRAVLDLVRERRPPFSPDDVTQEFAATLRTYGLHEVTGDRYAGEWPRERFGVHGIQYRPAERTKSEIYRELLPLVNAARVELLELPRLLAQLVSLERRTARGGRDSVDHAPGGHDDLANAAAGAVVLVGQSPRRRVDIL